MPDAPRAFHVLAKPAGPSCNLACRYCFYLEKEALFPAGGPRRMPDDLLERFVREYIATQDVPAVNFAWQGGEPTLLGVDFFRRAVAFQKKHNPAGKTIGNAFQTNGILLDDEWCGFLRENNFLVGLSLDGPRDLHDQFRRDRGGHPTFDRVMAAMESLKRHGVTFNVLSVVNRENARRPLDVYRFLRKHGPGFLQFIPLVERVRPDGSLAPPPEPGRPGGEYPVTPESVTPEGYGDFLAAIFDEWVRRDVGRVFVQLFDVTLGNRMGVPSTLCLFAETCGQALALEHNGDIFACDHYVYPEYRRGNVREASLGEIVFSEAQARFGAAKRDRLPGFCRSCDVFPLCRGECPKHRFAAAPDGEPGRNYLCAGYKTFFHHALPALDAMAGLIRAGRPAAGVMDILAARERPPAPAAPPGRNDSCPCGSGKKFKGCCGKK
ncbi:MAG: anaerobic sulfatase maturase [Planctomycetota bacterium]